MNIQFNQDWIIPIITAFCFVIGYIMKKWIPADDKYIPTVVTIVGALAGFFFFGNTFESLVCGAISGVASTGVHQIFKQYLKLPMGDDELYSMGKGEEAENESEQIS
jgi:hypothetical protein